MWNTGRSGAAAPFPALRRSLRVAPPLQVLAAEKSAHSHDHHEHDHECSGAGCTHESHSHSHSHSHDHDHSCDHDHEHGHSHAHASSSGADHDHECSGAGCTHESHAHSHEHGSGAAAGGALKAYQQKHDDAVSSVSISIEGDMDLDKVGPPGWLLAVCRAVPCRRAASLGSSAVRSRGQEVAE